MKNRYSSVRRHGILFLFSTMRSVFVLIPIGILIWFFHRYQYMLTSDMRNHILLPFLVISINYIFLQIILITIEFFGKITLIGPSHIILIHTSCILIDDIEFINMKTIIKLDIERHGLLANIFHFGHVIIEQKTAIRRIHYVPHPYEIYEKIKQQIPNQSLEDNQE